MEVSKDETIIITSGDYSDYSIRSTLTFLVACDLTILSVEYTEQLAPEIRSYTGYRGKVVSYNNNGPREDGFVSWLVANNYAKLAELRELHFDNPWRCSELEMNWC